ncbi:hypothetical protein [Microbulbifer magnicolonia]|uniref:hypothetical protein n=1 Tax=Microbulbifer magnicolonia TaxID=3109744 RepID=UPI002B40C8F5|nr:hypothetical protein [Microbulbifer sp. GG15]
MLTINSPKELIKCIGSLLGLVLISVDWREFIAGIAGVVIVAKSLLSGEIFLPGADISASDGGLDYDIILSILFIAAIGSLIFSFRRHFLKRKK